MNQLSAESIRHAVSQLILAGFVCVFSGCQFCCSDLNQQRMTTSVSDAVIMNAGYRETSWTSLEVDSPWEATVEYEENCSEPEGSGHLPIVLEQTDLNEATQHLDAELSDLAPLPHRDPGTDGELETVEVEILR